MNLIFEKFLRAKHWQIFTLTVGIPILLQFIIIGTMISSLATDGNRGPLMGFNYMHFFPPMAIICGGLFFGWFYSVAIGLQKIIPKDVTMKVRKFKIIFFIPIVYMFLFVAMWSIASARLVEPKIALNESVILTVVAVVILLHLLSMLCLFYSLYFLAKTFKTAELQRAVTFSDFAGEFLLIWFFPLGIWIVQPKINKMIEV